MKFEMKHLIYFCADMKRMTDFYTGLMGLKIVPNTKYPLDEWAELDGGSFKLCLHKAGKPGSAPHNRNKLVFRVGDVGKARAHLIKHGVKMGTHHHWGPMEASDGRDPEGNLLQVAGPAKRKKR